MIFLNTRIKTYVFHLLLFLPHKGRIFVAGCSMGPVLHYWYIWLERLCTGRALSTVGKKILADQLLGSPLVGIGFFLGAKND